MKRVIIITVLMLPIIFQACNSNSQVKDPKQIDVVGTWENPDGAMFIFKEDGTFSGTSFPAEFVLLPRDEYKNVRFDGNGKWALRKGNTNWEVFIDFKQVSDKRCSSAFPLLIAGESGILENKPPWYLFVWKEGEGGERYEFLKQETTKPQ
ncbi:hypothetical protein [Anaerocolumna jejuensis]|uniref:hypothetical protein n=1 Tax=Anaerocolumna jejuensis TaxID=259063 RepID=UPI003F7BF1FD